MNVCLGAQVGAHVCKAEDQLMLSMSELACLHLVADWTFGQSLVKNTSAIDTKTFPLRSSLVPLLITHSCVGHTTMVTAPLM